MNYQINIPEMKRKTEIEDRLLMQINKNLSTNKNDIEWMGKNFLYDDICLLSANTNTNKYINLNTNNFSNPEDKNKLIKKLLEYPDKIYSIFQCFYLKRKNFMGMNLTGLVKGKMETGLVQLNQNTPVVSLLAFGLQI